VEQDETFTVTIPVGVEEGMVLRVPGRGMPSRQADSTPGDLFIIVSTVLDPRFERHGADLWRTEIVQVADAVLGTELEVTTLDGLVMVTMLPGTQPDTVFCVRGKGLPEFGGSRHGDLYLRVQVHIPEHLAPAERELYERLRTLGKRRQ
jgi:molecular chaperone DnaJ